MQKLRIVTWGMAHEAVSRRPPISLNRIVARTHMYTNDANVWDLSLVQGPFSVARPNPTIRNFFPSLYGSGGRGSASHAASGQRRRSNARERKTYAGVQVGSLVSYHQRDGLVAGQHGVAALSEVVVLHAPPRPPLKSRLSHGGCTSKSLLHPTS
jgi:hypothetical protein